MISRIQVLNFRCLRTIDQSLDSFHILVGPNASGKTTFLDVPVFLGDILSNGLEEAVSKRSSDFRDLLFCREGHKIELAIECAVPVERRALLPANNGEYKRIRYEIAIGSDEEKNDIQIFDEQVILISDPLPVPQQLSFFPRNLQGPSTLMSGKRVASGKRVVRKNYDGNDNFYSEIASRKGQGGWVPSFRLGPKKSALGNMPEDETNFPVSTWLRQTLIAGTQALMLNSLALRLASPPGKGFDFRFDGSNIPWVIHHLMTQDPQLFHQWIGHVSTALPDLVDITTVELPDTRHRYLQLHYGNGLAIPSWMASDGTLRMLALTLPAYLKGFAGVYLIEEPENGVHPQAVETVYQSLSSVYSAQMLVATHSPVILGCARPEQILCFKKTEGGATDIVRGNDHPALRDWQKDIELSVLYASGVLG